MKTEIHIEQLLRWRLAKAEAAAPPAPSARHLLELSRPWWETMPEKLRSLLERLGKIQVVYGHAMAEPRQSHGGHPVPALIVGGAEEVEASARLVYLSIRDGRLRLRFQLFDGAPGQTDPEYDVTFISESAARPLFTGRAVLSADCEYRLDAEIPEELARQWERLKVTDRMPFRWILHTAANGR